MRVVAGELGGRRLRSPRGTITRPTADMVREALFEILGESVEGTHVLDLFAGSGALGIEALSRGAAKVTFVENDRRAADVVEANLRDLGVRERAELVRSDAMRLLRGAPSRGHLYDLALLDPPYADAARLGARLSELLPPVLAPGATVVSESDHRQPLDLDLPLKDERRYGDTLIRIHGT